MPWQLVVGEIFAAVMLALSLPGIIREDRLDREGWERWKCPDTCGEKCPLCHPRSR